MNLTGTSDLVRIVTSAAADIDVQASWVDQTTSAFTPGRTNTIVTTATTTTIVGSPAASTQRAVTSLKIRNDHASDPNTVTVLHTDGTTSVDVWKGTLAAGESVEYDGKTFERFTATGAPISGVAVVDTDVTLAANSDTLVASQKAAKAYIDAGYGERVFQSRMPSISALLLVEDKAYFVYLGRTRIAVTPKHVEFYVSIGGTGAQTAEVGLFSTPSTPSKAGQTLTKLVATGTVDDLTTTGVKRNTTAFATAIPSGTHLWAGIRTAMATNEPTIGGIGRDNSQGYILETATAGALTGAGPWTGALITPVAPTGAQCPELRAVLD